MKMIFKKIFGNIEKIWNIVTYIICGAILLAGIAFGVGMAVILSLQGDISFGILFACGISLGAFFISFTIFSFSKLIYDQLCYNGIINDR